MSKTSRRQTENDDHVGNQPDFREKLPEDQSEIGDRTVGDEAADPAPDPFDPESLRLTQDFAGAVAVKKVLTTVPCRKPNRHEFVRVRSGAEWRIETAVFEDKINRDDYLVDRTLWSELAGEIVPACLFLAINRQGDVFLWRVKLPGLDGRTNTWNESAVAAARLAETKWVRVSANMVAGLYDLHEATGNIPAPEWPDLSFQEILRLAFRDRFIHDVDHPVLRSLRGEA
jgi:hypothetical protein